MTTLQRFKVYVPAAGDILRTPAGQVKLFEDRAEAEAVARRHGGFIQPENAPSPGGFDRSFP